MINPNRLRKYLRIGMRRISQDLKTRLYLKTGFFMPGPERIYYFMTSKCNFRCKMCLEWKAGLAEQEKELLSEARMEELMDEMEKLGIREIGFSGGEPLICREKLLRLARYAKAKGIYTHIATNGFLLDEEFLREYDRMGGGHISLSIDGLGKKHDELRGFAGAFNGLEKVLALFKQGRYANILLKINFTLTNENFSEAPKVAGLAIENSAVIFFQPYDPYDYGGGSGREYLEDRYPLWVRKENYSQLESIINELKNLKKMTPGVLLNSAGHLSDMLFYFQGNKNIARACYGGLDQISIFPKGEVVFCKFGQLGSLKNMGIAEFLNSRERKAAVKASLQCRENCLLGCQYRPGFSELIKNGARQLIKLSEVRK